MERRRGLAENERYKVTGTIEADIRIGGVANAVNVRRNTVWRLINRHRQTGTPKDRPQTNRPKKLTPRPLRHAGEEVSACYTHFVASPKCIWSTCFGTDCPQSFTSGRSECQKTSQRNRTYCTSQAAAFELGESASPLEC